MTQRFLRCYAHGRDGSWEAICVDLDLATHGRSFDEVRTMLNSMIETYVTDALREEPAVAARLLDRKSPWHVRAKLFIRSMQNRRPRKDRRSETYAGFDLSCPA